MFPSILPIPELFEARKILCVQPHYDDNDIGAGGSLAVLRDSGAVLTYLTVTDDLMGILDTQVSAENATAQLRAEQARAAETTGVSHQYWLGYPDAGSYDYYALRREMIKFIRLLRPDIIFAPDPWLTYEAHRDHILTGQAVAEAAIMYQLPRIPSDPQVDAAYHPYELSGVAFYFTREPNTAVNTSRVWERKERAIRCYQSQFTPDSMDQLIYMAEARDRLFGQRQGCTHAEGLKVMHPNQLHCAF